jgi:uncharacterized RDD family membrane protein YckC
MYLLIIITIVLMALSRQKRGLHDLIADTCVINARATVLQPEEVEDAEPEQSEPSKTDTPKQG